MGWGGYCIPKGKLDDKFGWACLSGNFMWQTGAVIAGPLLCKPYCCLYLTACSWDLLKTFRVVQFDQHTPAAYDTRTFQYAVHSCKSPVAMPSQKMAVQNINTKKRVGEMHV